MVARRLAIFLVLAATGGLLAAEPKGAAIRAYERGARELEFGRFGEAAAAFAEAIALDPRESPQPVARPSGMNFEPYLPHLALGIARCETGDPAGALASWAESDRQAAARGARGAARLLQRREECNERHRESLRAAEGARGGGTSPGPTAEPAAPTPDLNPPPEAATAVVVPSPAEEAKANAPARPPALSAASDTPPELLLRAAQELFDGRPTRAYAMLEGFASDRPRSNGQAHLLRSAASFELARVEPDNAARWLTRARRERLATLRSAPALLPDRRYFAPGFIEFFTTGGAPAALPDLLEP